MSRFKGMKHQEIAADKGVTINTVQKQISIALERIRAALGAYLTSFILFVIRFFKKKKIYSKNRNFFLLYFLFQLSTNQKPIDMKSEIYAIITKVLDGTSSVSDRQTLIAWMQENEKKQAGTKTKRRNLECH
jgi:hypothetical protein